MADVVDQPTRSRMMAGIKGVNTDPELRLRRALHRLGLRFRLHRRDLPGRPDIVFPACRAVVFVHGCFWHRHDNCRYATTPTTRADFWAAKFKANVERDRRNLANLAEQGWDVRIVWECEIRSDVSQAAADVASWIARFR